MVIHGVKKKNLKPQRFHVFSDQLSYSMKAACFLCYRLQMRAARAANAQKSASLISNAA